MSIRTKIMLLLLICSITPLVITGYLQITSSQKILEEQIGTGSLEFASLAMSKVGKFVHEKYNAVGGWSRAIDSADLIHSIDQGKASAYLADTIVDFPEYHYAVLLDKTGKIVARVA